MLKISGGVSGQISEFWYQAGNFLSIEGTNCSEMNQSVFPAQSPSCRSQDLVELGTNQRKQSVAMCSLQAL